MSVLGAGLHDKYEFAQLHFHWGNNSKVGSEHLINGRAFPLEVHFVHFNSRYVTLGEAVGHEDGLAVIGVMFHVSNTDNEALAPIIEAAGKVTKAKQKTVTSKDIKLESLLPEDPDKFYRYQGSLTTPGCNEIVTWSVLHSSIPVSEKQLKTLRSVLDADGHMMGNNYRYKIFYTDIFNTSLDTL